MTTVEMAENDSTPMDSEAVFQTYIDKTSPRSPATDHQ